MNIGRLGFYLLHPATFLIVSTLLLIGGGNSLWQKYGDRISPPESLTLHPDQIRINEPGAWATPGFTRLVSEEVNKLEVTLGNPAAIERIAAAVNGTPAIEDVSRIEKTANGVDITAVWRKPVAAIRMPAGYYRLVDRQGVILDRQATSETEANEWLRISLYRAGGEQLADWQVWQDNRVLACAAIAGELGDRWRDLGLTQIVTFRYPDSLGPTNGSFELWTSAGPKGAKVIWSDDGATEEPLLVDTRIEAIRTWIRANGGLDKLVSMRMMLDVRTGVAKLISDEQVATLPGDDGSGIF